MTHYIDVEHAGLAKFRRISGSDPFVVKRRAEEQVRQWERQWQRQQATELAKEKRLQRAFDRNKRKELAVSQTEELRTAIEEFRQILKPERRFSRGQVGPLLADRSAFNEPPPVPPDYEAYPLEPKLDDEKFRPSIPVLYYLIPFLKRKRIRRATDLWRIEHAEWEDALSEIEAQNNDRYAEHEKSMQEWSEREQAFKASQVELNSRLKELQQRHLDKDPDAIVEFTDLILSRSQYPDCFPKNWEIGFDGATGVMVVDYDLPDVAQLPKFGAVRYIQARNAFENILLKDKEGRSF